MRKNGGSQEKLKTWAKTLSIIKEDITDTNALIALIDSTKKFKDLISSEYALRKDLEAHLTLLHQW